MILTLKRLPLLLTILTSARASVAASVPPAGRHCRHNGSCSGSDKRTTAITNTPQPTRTVADADKRPPTATPDRILS
jgi:hypothetical protein